ncbi:hypothetical protein ASF15_01135 [Pseudomonas sp. Leaf83]|jgi:hypothetical protein|nr:hypothetical protein [Pseudomonas sp. Leaf83]KQO43885.1 hypothetical protein ASF15_01135 [Pseudomonas sp. Leaf83]
MDIENDSFEMDGDFLKGVAPVNVEHTELKLKDEFAPWHKPRKQWIRDKQWAALIGALIDRLKLQESGRSLDYLSLPGLDLLDVRALEETLTAKRVKIKYLGLNHISEEDKESRAELNLSENEVRALDFVEQGSLVISEQFEKIADHQSIAGGRVLQEHKTFDVVNVDLCASFADKKPGTSSSLYQAIYKLIMHQSFYRSEDWLFLITTRTDKKKVDFDALKVLLNTAFETVSEDIIQEFLSGKAGVDLNKIKSKDFSQGDLTTDQHRTCFTSSLSIWKSTSLLQGEAKSSSKLCPMVGYHVESTDAVADMVSMAFWCSRLPLVAHDKSGLSGASINKKAQTPEQVHNAQARRAFERSLQCIDLDEYLEKNPDEYRESLERSKNLLKKARYSIDRYDEWVEQQKRRAHEMIGR